MTQDKTEVLTQAAEIRRNDVMMHQINIDNYRAALAEIEQNHQGDGSLEPFAEQLRGLLETSLLEQKKEAIMLKVITSQLEAENGSTD